MYAGQIAKGIMIFVIQIVLGVLSMLMLFSVGTTATSALGGVVIILLIEVAILIWSIFDVNKVINEYNTHIRRTGNPPW
jgi:hypothetical protein